MPGVNIAQKGIMIKNHWRATAKVSVLIKKFTPVKKAARERIPTPIRRGMSPMIKRAIFEKRFSLNRE